MTIIPRARYILVKPDKEESRVSEHGIVTPVAVEQERKAIGTVIAVGELVDGLSKGAHIVFATYSGDILKLKNETFVLVHDDDILAVIEE